MATSAWANVLEDTFEAIEAIDPTYDVEQCWRHIARPRKRGDGARDREFDSLVWKPNDVRVFGGNEDQLGRDLQIRVSYTNSEGYEDRRHSDEQDLITALEPRSTYPSGSWGSLHVRRVMRESIEVFEDDQDSGHIFVIYPIRLIWREDSSHI